MSALVLRRASIRPGSEVDLVIIDGRVAAERPPPGADAVDLAGRPVLLGFTDHHIHLSALAASWSSVDLSPGALVGSGGLGQVLRAARVRQPSGWLRGIGYDIASSGPLDRRVLDDLAVGPLRVQDRTGIRWVLDSRGLAALLPEDGAAWPDGVQRDGSGQATGVLVRLDRWLRDRLPQSPPDLTATGRWLAGRGVTTVTDAGAENGPAELAMLAAAALPQRVVAMTRDVDIEPPDAVELGPVKILLDDDRLPSFTELEGRIATAHQRGRSVAVHCVTDVQVALALAAGITAEDRIEHCSYLPAGLVPPLVEANPTIVVQPGLVATRGDRYLDDHDPDEQPALHRLGSLLRAGLRVAVSTDAPYGPADPWIGIAAAANRRTPSGRILGPAETVDARCAAALLATDPHDPGTPLPLAAGREADLVILDDSWDRLAREPAVAATIRHGTVIAGSLDVVS